MPPPSFLDKVGEIFTTSFTQHATSQLTFKGPALQGIRKDKLTSLGYQTAINLLHDHEKYMRLNPIVIDTHEIDPTSDEGLKLDVPALLDAFKDPDDADQSKPEDVEDINHTRPGSGGQYWRHYSITDSLPHPFGLPGTTNLTYQAALHDLRDGFESLVLAAAGVTIYGRLRVRESAQRADGESGFAVDIGERGLWLQEKVEVRCWLGMGWYIQKSLGESHGVAHERFRAWWEGEVRRRVVAGVWEGRGRQGSEDSERTGRSVGPGRQ